jgi:hypothetical protein
VPEALISISTFNGLLHQCHEKDDNSYNQFGVYHFNGYLLPPLFKNQPSRFKRLHGSMVPAARAVNTLAALT